MKKSQPEVHASHIERMLRQMEHSSRRWEKMVFPAVIAFILLAGYGFFLIYSLSRDMNSIAQIIQNEYRHDMSQISADISKMVVQVEGMRESVVSVSRKMDPLQDMGPLLAEIKQLDDSVGRISGSMANMDQSVIGMSDSMTRLDDSMYYMGRDVGDMNDSFSSPTKLFKRMMPW